MYYQKPLKLITYWYHLGDNIFNLLLINRQKKELKRKLGMFMPDSLDNKHFTLIGNPLKKMWKKKCYQYLKLCGDIWHVLANELW